MTPDIRDQLGESPNCTAAAAAAADDDDDDHHLVMTYSSAPASLSPFQGSPGSSSISRDDTTAASSSGSQWYSGASRGPMSAMNSGSRSFRAKFSSNCARVIL